MGEGNGRKRGRHSRQRWQPCKCTNQGKGYASLFREKGAVELSRMKQEMGHKRETWVWF